jgi:hypothetical protein
LSSFTPVSSRFDLVEPLRRRGDRASEPPRVDERFRPYSNDDEGVSHPSVQRPPLAPAASGSKLAEPLRAFHIALMRERQRRADRGEFLDRVHHCYPFLDR